MFVEASRGEIDRVPAAVLAKDSRQQPARQIFAEYRSTGVRHLLETSGVRVIRTHYRAPNCNAYAERFVRSIKEECLSRVIPLGERHFRRTLAEFVVHYHRERNHHGLGNDLFDGVRDPHDSGSVRRRQRIGGLLSYYYRAA